VLNGIDVDRFSVAQPSELRRQLAGTRESFVIGAVGRLTVQKGLEYLIQAMPSILAQHPDCTLVLVGDGPLETHLRNLACSLKVDHHCQMPGFRADVPELLACLDVFVQPSLREGLSITLLEGMAAAKPVVATAIKGNREVISPGVDGVLVEPVDSEALARTIVKLIQDREGAQAMGSRAREKIRQHFSQAAMVDKTLRWYGIHVDDEASKADQTSHWSAQLESVAGHRP
jgi:glycosyltransferase involved in cell wall biosynthesis